MLSRKITSRNIKSLRFFVVVCLFVVDYVILNTLHKYPERVCALLFIYL